MGTLLYEQSTYLVQRLGKDEEEQGMPSFSFSSFGTTTNPTSTDTAPADAAEAPTKGSSKEEAVNGTAEADRLFAALAAVADRGGGVGGGNRPDTRPKE